MSSKKFMSRKLPEETMGLFPKTFSAKEIYEFMDDYAKEYHIQQSIIEDNS